MIRHSIINNVEICIQDFLRAFASEWQANIEEMFPWSFTYSDTFSMLQFSTTQECVTLYERVNILK